MTLPPFWMVFDVESVGLHGEGFAVGWVVIDADGKETESGRLACRPGLAVGSEEGRAWVRDNIPPVPANCSCVNAVRATFWAAWERLRGAGAVLAADCCWPVEARFLLGCMASVPGIKPFDGPYPLIDVASVRLAAGFDPLGTEERLPDELPAHDPLADARQSARLLIEALTALRSAKLKA